MLICGLSPVYPPPESPLSPPRLPNWQTRENEDVPPARRPSPLLRAVAASLDAPPALVRVLPELFRGIEALGSMPRRTARMLGAAGIGPRSRVLDLACGKGAVAIELARRLRCRVVGVDAFAPFIDAARDAATRRRVTRMCTFRVGDVTRFRSVRPFDAALMIGLFPLERAAALLRRHVKPGGVYLIDDAFLDSRRPRRKGLGGVPTLAEARAFIARSGDRLLAEHVPTPAALRRLNASLFRRLSRRARSIARTDRRLAPTLREFLARQRHANRLMEGTIRPAIWLIRRTR